MRDFFVQVRPAFMWVEAGRKLRAAGGPMALLLGSYLWTAPSGNLIGLFYLPLVTMGAETGMGPEELHAALNACARADFAYYGAEREEVWLPAFMERTIGERMKAGDLRRPAVEKMLAAARASRFFGDLLDRYGGPYALTGEAPSKPLASPSEGPREGHRSPPSKSDSSLGEEGASPLSAASISPVPPSVDVSAAREGQGEVLYPELTDSGTPESVSRGRSVFRRPARQAADSGVPLSEPRIEYEDGARPATPLAVRRPADVHPGRGPPVELRRPSGPGDPLPMAATPCGSDWCDRAMHYSDDPDTARRPQVWPCPRRETT